MERFESATLLSCTFILCLDLSVYLNINQLDALNFIMSLFHASTCFEHVLIVRKSKLYYTASGIITPVGVMIPETVLYNFGLLTMSTCARNM